MAKGRYRKRSSTTVAKSHFPIGELAKRKKQIAETFISKLEKLKKEQKKTDRLTARVSVYFQMHQITEPISMASDICISFETI
jgi:hypothetical protein